jgi:hypothetical protein
MAVKMVSPAAIFEGYKAKKFAHVCWAASAKSWGLSVQGGQGPTRHRHKRENVLRTVAPTHTHISMYIYLHISLPLYLSICLSICLSNPMKSNLI